MKRYVWLNLMNGEFSDTWTDENLKNINMSIEDLNKDVREGWEGWKLIEFECLSDPNFVFTRHMKLR